MRKEEEAEMIARECNISAAQRQKLHPSPTFVFISGNKTLAVDRQPAGTLSFWFTALCLDKNTKRPLVHQADKYIFILIKYEYISILCEI